MKLREYIQNHIVYLDGGFGTELQKRGMKSGERSEQWNLSHPDDVIAVHKAYFDAGSNVVMANTFGANALTYSDEQMKELIGAAVTLARRAAELSEGLQEKFVALDISSLGRLLKPYGDLDFEEAVECFKKAVVIGAECGVDLICIETMTDSYETKAALLAAKENCDLPVFVTNAYGSDGKLMTGADACAMTALLEGMRVDAFGANCSLGPEDLFPVIDTFLAVSSHPVIFKPNAGLPVVDENGKTVFLVEPDEFADAVCTKIKDGVRIVGGCCGTTPAHIKALVEKSHDLCVSEISPKNMTLVSSYTHAVDFANAPILIGERLNPTGKKKLKQALIDEDMSYILNEGLKQVEYGVHILDVNAGLPELCEPKVLADVVKELQAVTDVPLSIDTSDALAMEKTLRIYNGKALINSVNGKEEVMDAIFPLAAKYGGAIIALTLDENGIPDTADGRVAIAKRIIEKAATYGIGKNDLIFDTLAMTVSADQNAANVTMEALHRIHCELGAHTSLGLSNVSFGLPLRNIVNSTFYAMTLSQGLSAAIMNPFSDDMMKVYYSFRTLTGRDANCMEYIEAAEVFEKRAAEVPVKIAKTSVTESAGTNDTTESSALMTAIEKGIKKQALLETQALLSDGNDPLSLVQEQIIPALNSVGKRFEEKKIYLPQLLMSAEAAQSAFGAIKEKMQESRNADSATEERSDRTVVIATVKGDIHDIGKNIVRLLLENYGFDVIDLGKDVDPEIIVDKVLVTNAAVCGLSALMTTTVPAMEETIRLIHARAPFCKVVVGGAVLTQEYADRIEADAYSPDAMSTVRFAQKCCI